MRAGLVILMIFEISVMQAAVVDATRRGFEIAAILLILAPVVYWRRFGWLKNEEKGKKP